VAGSPAEAVAVEAAGGWWTKAGQRPSAPDRFLEPSPAYESSAFPCLLPMLLSVQRWPGYQPRASRTGPQPPLVGPRSMGGNPFGPLSSLPPHTATVMRRVDSSAGTLDWRCRSPESMRTQGNHLLRGDRPA
jgi:hypothetical protein